MSRDDSIIPQMPGAMPRYPFGAVPAEGEVIFFAVADGHLLDYSGKVDDHFVELRGTSAGRGITPRLAGAGSPRRRGACTP